MDTRQIIKTILIAMILPIICLLSVFFVAISIIFIAAHITSLAFKWLNGDKIKPHDFKEEFDLKLLMQVAGYLFEVAYEYTINHK